MNYSKLISSVGFIAAAATGACTESLCAVHPEDAQCQPGFYTDYQTAVTMDCSATGFDTRSDFVVNLAVSVTGDAPARPARLLAAMSTPSVYLQTDGAEFLVPPDQIQTKTDSIGLNVTVKKDQLGTGPLKLRVALSPTAIPLQGQAQTTCAVTRSPMLGEPQPVKLTDSPRSTPITGLVGVQIGTVVGADRQLLFVEQFTGGMGGPERWVDLYTTDSTGNASRDSSVPLWSMKVQAQLLESPIALFAATQDVLLIYDVYLKDPQRQLSMFSLVPLSPTRNSVLGSADANLGNAGTTIAAASDDQLMLLGSPGNLSWFRISAQPTPSYSFVGKTTLITGEPVLAARAERLKDSPLSPGPYFGAAWDKSTDNAILLEVIASDAGKATDLAAVALKTRLAGGFQSVLGSEHVAAVALGDLNGDGLEDLLVATDRSRFLWAAQQLDHSFAAASALKVTAPPGPITALAIGDVTKDRIADLAVIAGQKAFVYLGL